MPYICHDCGTVCETVQGGSFGRDPHDEDGAVVFYCPDCTDEYDALRFLAADREQTDPGRDEIPF